MRINDFWRIAMGALALAAGFSAQAQNASRPALSSPRLYVIDGGVLASVVTRYDLKPEQVQSAPLSIAAYLIVHPRGVLLWDTGAVPDKERVGEAAGANHHLVLADGQDRNVTLGEPLLPQLAAIGYQPSDITYLALSHYHWDHTANANEFAGAIWLARKVERDYMFDAKATGSIRPTTYQALRNARTQIVTDDEHDVFGDGTVIMKLAPGHTPGHSVLYVKLANTGGVLLAGDLYHYPEERALGKLPNFEVDPAATRAARAEVDRFLERTGATLWIQHDLVAHRKLKKAPEYYD
ncbi:MAG TPA: N-acyl homoserine lactonase family protein [Gammaproteobacteria bacterium]|nr:N-acyl homoserine lactonase family protein [Gammaproteobacteria bacterium]